jgi:hypothetical protein
VLATAVVVVTRMPAYAAPVGAVADSLRRCQELESVRSVPADVPIRVPDASYQTIRMRTVAVPLARRRYALAQYVTPGVTGAMPLEDEMHPYPTVAGHTTWRLAEPCQA